MSNKIILKTLLLASLMLGGTSVVLAHSTETIDRSQSVTHEALRANEADKFAGSTLLEEDALNVSLTRSTVTASSQAYDVTFSSQITAYTFGNRNVFVRITDSNYTGEEEKQEDETLRPVYSGEVMRIENVFSNTGDVIIPERLGMGTKFFIGVDTIAGNALGDPNDAGNVKSVLIPASVKTIADSAFELLAGRSDVAFNIISKKDDTTISYDETVFPEGCKINWGYEPTAAEAKALNSKVRAPLQPYGNGKDYMIGFNGEGEYHLPLTVGYFIQKEGQPDTYHTLELPISSVVNNYDAVGSLSAMPSFDKTIDIPLLPGESVDDDRIYILNIYEVELDPSGKLLPKLTRDPKEGETGPQPGNYYAHARKSYILKDHLDNYIDFTFQGTTSYSGYTSVAGKINVVDGIYQKMQPKAFEDNKKGLEDGTVIIRYRFTSLNIGKFRITYLNEADKETTISVPIRSRYDYYNLPGTNNIDLNFLIKDSDVAPDFSADRLLSLELENFYISLDLFVPLEQRTVTKSSFSTRFGIMEFVPYSGETASYLNLDLVAILTIVVYTILYILAAIGYFLYAKNAFKNDEFKRVKPKLFIKNAVIGYAGIGIILTAIMFIFFRFGPLNNSSVVFNPTDPLVVGFAVAALLVIGYFAKTAVTMTKANIAKRKADKLKLNEDVADDGTK